MNRPTRPGQACWILVGLLALACPSPAGAQTPAASDHITMDFGGLTLNQAIQFIVRDRPINLVSGEIMDEVVQMKFTNVHWKEAFNSLLKIHGYTQITEGSIVRIMRFDAADQENQKPVVHSVELEYADPLTVKEALEPMLSPEGKIVVLNSGAQGGLLSIVDIVEKVEILKTIIASLDLPPPEAKSDLVHNGDGTLDVELVSFPLAEIPAFLQRELGLNVVTEVPLTGRATEKLEGITFDTALQLILEKHGYSYRKENGVYRIGKGDEFRQQLVTREFRLRYIDGWDLRESLEPLLSERGRIAYYSPSPRQKFEFGSRITDPRTLQGGQTSSGEKPRSRAKVIHVIDQAPVIEAIGDLIESLDVAPQQIEVNVKIVQLERSKGSQKGIDWNTVVSMAGSVRPTTLPWGPEDGRYFPGTFPDPPDEANFAFGSLRADQLTAVLKLLEQSENAEVISQPNITTLDNAEASILIGQKFPVTSETIDPQTAVRTVVLDYYEDIGIQLLVVPNITENDRINLIIHPAVSQLNDLVEDRFPIIDTRESDTTVELRSGDTAVIGGLIERREESLERKVPFLGDLPLFGHFFRYTERVDMTTELIIFVTPRIVLDNDQLEASLLLEDVEVERLESLHREFERILER